MYTLGDYLWMLADETRVTAYSSAINAVVKPGDRVIEIGAGIGFFSVLAARAGAAHVDALETNPLVHLGPRIAEANGCGDRIAFHQIDAERFATDVAADVVIADVRGPTPLAGTALRVMIDARRRLLRAGGTIVPARDALFCAPARRPATFRREVEAGLARPEMSLAAAARVAYDIPIRCPIQPDELLAEGRAWAEIDYATNADTDRAGEASWTFDRAASIGGLAIWFESQLGDNIRLSTRPGGPAHVYSQMFVPFSRHIDVEPGSLFRAAIDARLVQGEYVWSWSAWLTHTGSAAQDLALSQNSLAERVVDPALLLQHRSGR